MEQTYLSISQVNNYIKNIFEAETMLQNICIFGEVSSYNISNGIAYFNLKDENNLLPCVLFNALRFDSPKIGDVILVTGSVSYYAKGGRLSFQAVKIAPYGKGMLYERFLELKNKLEGLGYFAAERKKPLPRRVQKIGVVTSPTGAVVQDIIDVATRRNSSVDIIVYPSKVQGVGAEFEIAKGISFFNTFNVDCIIVARGGGSLEDLQPFNTEIVAEAAFNSVVPLVSAVGHETDFTILDFVSDLRAPTPSAAAELVVNSKLDDYNLIKHNLVKMQKAVVSLQQKYLFNISQLISKGYGVINETLGGGMSAVEKSVLKMKNGFDNKLTRYDNALQMQLVKIGAQNPQSLIEKGFTKIEKQSKVVKDISELSEGNEVSFMLCGGNAHAKILKTVKEQL